MTVYVVIEERHDDGEILGVDSVWTVEEDAKARCEVIKTESRRPLCYPLDADYLVFEVQP